MRALFAVFICAVLVCGVAADPVAGSAVTKSTFGRLPDGRAIDAYTLTNSRGTVATVITYGAILADLQLPSAHGGKTSVIKRTTFSPENLERGFPQSGAIIGRVANRVSNARFTLDGREHRLAANIPPHHLHGGRVGFANVLWQGETITRNDGPAVQLTYISADGEEGYPGRLETQVVYTLTQNDTLRIDYTATTDKPTIVNLTNHAYFNLNGSGEVGDDLLEIAAEQYTAADRMNVPTGELRAVAGTALDFRQPTALAARTAGLQERGFRYDHNWVLRTKDGTLGFAARLTDPQSNRTMEVWTTEPGLQVYTPFPLNEPLPEGRMRLVCLETQHFPDAINQPRFPSIVLRPGHTFRSTTEYRFTATR